MISFYRYLRQALVLIPLTFKKKIPIYFSFSIVNLLLDIFSIGIIFPLLLVFLEKETSFQFLKTDVVFNKEHILPLILGIVLFFIIKNYLSIKIFRYQTSLIYKLANFLSVKSLKHYLYNDYLNFKQQKKASIVKDVIQISNSFTDNVLLSANVILIEVLFLTIILCIGFFLNPIVMICLIAILMSTIIIVQYLNHKRIRRLNDSLTSNYVNNITNLLNIIQGYFEIKTSNKEADFLDRFYKSNNEVNAIYSDFRASRLASSKQTEIIVILGISTILVLSMILPKSYGVDEVFVSFLIASSIKVLPSLSKLMTNYTTFKANVYSIQNVQQFNDVQEKTNSNPPPFKDKISLNNISFQYDETDTLKKINLVIKKGAIVGLIGDSGSGKTTLLNIILGLIPPKHGDIFIDSKNVVPDSTKGYLNLIAYVPQSPLILEGSIIENITLSTKFRNEIIEKIKPLIDNFRLNETINTLPQGLNTYIGNNGHNLSGGQKQRLAIIRAILTNPEILILDEATNELDENLESIIFDYLRTLVLTKKMTVIVVSHKKAKLMESCDQVYSLDNGSLNPLR